MDNQNLITNFIRFFFSTTGRMNRSRYWGVSIPFWLSFWALFYMLETSVGETATLFISPLFILSVGFLSARRLHDRDKSAWWLLILLIPIAGPVYLFIELALLKGTVGSNRFGEDPIRMYNDYLTVK